MNTRSRQKKNHPDGDASPRTLQFIDLFSGCGGFTLGMERAGLRALAAIDFNAEAVATLAANLPHVPHVLHRDLTVFGPEALGQIIGAQPVDVIVGGPPCQGFSTARQRDGANHGKLRLVDDPRRHLYKHFLKYVGYFQPMLFVMENVLGIRSAAGGEYFTRVHAEARLLGYRVHGQVEDAWELGAPQKRRRQLIIGVRNDVPGYFPPDVRPAARAVRRPSLGAAIGDLPMLRAGSGDDESDYDAKRRKEWLSRSGSKARRFLYGVAEVGRTVILTNHVARPHSTRDLRDFARLKEGESSATAMRDRGVAFEFPYDKSTFKDRYTRQSRSKPCSTIVAHMSKDGLMFIHPTQNRSLTPREAARVQTFPDWFRFPGARTHSFRLIGNAVPPLVAEAVGIGVRNFLAAHAFTGGRGAESRRTFERRSRTRRLPAIEIPTYETAVPELERVAFSDARSLRKLAPSEFARTWWALLFLMPTLHPLNALDHGDVEQHWPEGDYVMPSIAASERRLFSRSGWPVPLTAFGREAWQRHTAGELPHEHFYCLDVQRAGIAYRSATREFQKRVLASR